MPTRMHFPKCVNARRKTALYNLELRVIMNDASLVADAKRFKGKKDISEKEINNYRAYLNEQIKTLKGRL